jgi:hypothetical protein
MGGLTGADEICQTHANEAGLAGMFRAWLSDSRSSASARLTHSAGTYVLPLGTPVANDWNGLVSGAILHEIDQSASGALVGETVVRTGTTTAGAYSGLSCKDWVSSANADGSTYGESYLDNSYWTAVETLNVACDYATGLYCVEQ